MLLQHRPRDEYRYQYTELFDDTLTVPISLKGKRVGDSRGGDRVVAWRRENKIKKRKGDDLFQQENRKDKKEFIEDRGGERKKKWGRFTI